ncbi:MAG TPA: hypothetical protein VH475_23125 [Tepidisphaeraceae bacterium]
MLLAWPAFAWSNKEHIQLTRIAVEHLLVDPQTPPAMKDWLRMACTEVLTPDQEREYFMKQRIGLVPRGVDGVCYWATVPDMMAIAGGSGENERKVEPFGVGESKLHYVDLEYFIREEEKRRYRHDLKNKPFLFDIPDNMKDDKWKKAGMLPFRIEQCYAQLVKSIRDKRLVDKPGQFPRDEHATRWAGYLAHYLEDNTQPQHATEDYKSRSYFADKRNSPNVHADMEYRLMDDEEADYMPLRKEFWSIFERQLEEVKDPVENEDLRTATLEVSLASYDALPLIGLAAMEAYGQGGTPDHPEGKIGKFDANAFFHFKGKYGEHEMTVMEMKAYQMAWAVKRVERLWRRAWDEAQRPVEQP